MRQTRRVRKIYVIGIGAGDPDHLTIQAVKALNKMDVFFLLDKGAEKSDLIRLRHNILQEHIGHGRGYRLVEARDPDRDRAAGVPDTPRPSTTGGGPGPASTSA